LTWEENLAKRPALVRVFFDILVECSKSPMRSAVLELLDTMFNVRYVAMRESPMSSTILSAKTSADAAKVLESSRAYLAAIAAASKS
jgi:hypothetical protein